MEVVILADPDAVADLCARIVGDLVARRPKCVLGLATGDTPRRTYRRLAAAVAAGEVRFADTHAVALDEYLGLPIGHPQAYRTYLLNEFVAGTDLPAGALHVPEVADVDVPAACAAYEQLLRSLGGVDLQLLGVGTDGHIGFNEPGSSLASRTRLKTLHPRTVADNARFFDRVEDVPRHVVTQGVGTVLDARHLVLLATGAQKAAAVAATVEGPVTAFVPASALQLHPHVTVLVDEAAAMRLQLADYYRSVHAGKPAWQGY